MRTAKTSVPIRRPAAVYVLLLAALVFAAIVVAIQSSFFIGEPPLRRENGTGGGRDERVVVGGEVKGEEKEDEDDDGADVDMQSDERGKKNDCRSTSASASLCMCIDATIVLILFFLSLCLISRQRSPSSSSSPPLRRLQKSLNFTSRTPPYSSPRTSPRDSIRASKCFLVFRGADKCYNRSICEEHLNLILPAKPPFHSQQFQTCAVVGNSGDLFKTEFGFEIDGHDAVFRDNDAPVNEVVG
ncbi:hypothetical protein BHE74_00010398 [Ensete ventricosum]|nr:hypothetical protein BHE74_00010398 [Ensete ventricosum]